MWEFGARVRHLTTVTLASAASLALMAGTADAATITHTFDFEPSIFASEGECTASGEGQPLDVCGFNASLGTASVGTIPGFDPAQGTLTRVSFIESVSVSGLTSYDRLADSTIEQLGVAISFGLDVGYGADPNGNFLGIGIAFLASDNACDGIQVGETCTIEWTFESQHERDMTGEAIDFGIAHDIVVQGVLGAQTVGSPRLNPLTFQFTGTPTARFQVVYEYTPVPEPGTAALVALGLGLLGRRPRRSSPRRAPST